MLNFSNVFLISNRIISHVDRILVEAKVCYLLSVSLNNKENKMNEIFLPKQILHKQPNKSRKICL